MDQESGVSSAGSFIFLHEHEQRFYSGLHGRCQADTSGKLSSGKVAELFTASQLPPESLQKVTEVCGAKRLGYFGTAQFYVALKLIAAAQSSLPIRLESVTATLPLPRFVGIKNEPETRYAALSSSADAQCPATRWSPAERSTFRHVDASVEKKEQMSPPGSTCSSPPRSPSAYQGYHYNKNRNGAESQIAYESKHPLRPVVQMEPHASPSKYGTNPTVEHPAVPWASSVEPLDQQNIVDHSDDDPWRITEEQLVYYTNQFKTLQPDLGALILGAVAKNFFTKSKLSIPELSHIWELSDVDRDGALTFAEFCTAFHLIVARKNGYPLPESLPPTLQPGFLQQEGELPHTSASAEPLIVFEEDESRQSNTDQHIIERQSNMVMTKQELMEESCKLDTGLKRMASQEKQRLHIGAFPAGPDDRSTQELDPHTRTKNRPRSYSSTSIDDAMKKAEEPPTPPPRPQKTHSRASSLDLNKLFQQATPGVKSGWLLPPPALPPRPSTSQVPHFVKGSDKSSQNKVLQPNFADFSRFKEEEESSVKMREQSPRSRFGHSTEDLPNASKPDMIGGSHSQAPQKPIRRKYHPDSQNMESGPPAAMPFPPSSKPTQKLLSRQKREIQMAIRKNKETNAVLTRLNSELQQQFKVVHQERVTLESQLDLLRPLAST